MIFPNDILEFLEYVSRKQNRARAFRADVDNALKLIDFNMIWSQTLDGCDYWVQSVNLKYSDDAIYDLVRNSKEYGSWQFQQRGNEPPIEFDPNSIQLLRQFTEDN